MSDLYLPRGAAEFPVELQRKLQYGSPTDGWRGDPNMALVRCPLHKGCPSWVVSYARPDGKTSFLLHSPDSRIDSRFLRMLAKADSQTAEEKIAEIDAHNEAEEARNARIEKERIREHAERLTFEIGKVL